MAQSSIPVAPPIDGSVNIAEALDFHVKHNPNEPMFIYSEDKSPHQPIKITYLEFARACDRVAHVLRPGRTGADGRTVAIILLADTITYDAVFIGLIRAGLVPFPISPRNTPAAIIRLLKNTSCHDLVATQTTLRALLDGIKEELRGETEDWLLNIIEMPPLDYTYPRLGSETATDPFEPYPQPEERPPLDSIVLYLHSSGSSGWPKVIPQTQRIMIEWGTCELGRMRLAYPEYRVLAGMPLPPFHTIGIQCQVFCPLFGVLPCAVYPPVVRAPDALPIVPTPENILEHAIRTGCNFVVTVPSILHLWSRSQEAIDFLKTVPFVGYGGGPLAEKSGQKLADAGIKLFTIYGATEFGPRSSARRDLNYKEDWQWFRFSSQVKIGWEDLGNGTYECLFLTCDTHHPAIQNIESPPGYATSDIFIKHPTKPDLWKIVGRRDEIITHSSGEKTMPGPMEENILMSPLVQGVVMFGRGHDRAGVLIELRPDLQDDVKDDKKLSALRNDIWPFVEEANRNAPAFSHIYKEMIIFTSRDKPMSRAAKGTIMKKATLQLYEDEIESLYHLIASLAGIQHVQPPSEWTRAIVLEWLQNQAIDVLSGGTLSPLKDLFAQGFDSLSATFLRLRLTSALLSCGQPIDNISQNVVYEHPTLVDLAQFVVKAVAGQVQSSQSNEQAIEAMIEKYSLALEQPICSALSDRLENPVGVLLTGSTGNVGSYILANLLADERVHRIYALNRAGKQSVEERQIARFKDRGLDIKLLKNSKLHFIEMAPSKDLLGLSRNLYSELRRSVNVIIHNAWTLDFKLKLPSFEHHIRATRTLIDLARQSSRSSEMRFFFVSSMAAAQAWDRSKGPYPEEVVKDTSSAVGNGYGESKYVAERILERSGLSTCIVRVGQLSGGSLNGSWPTTDWFPLLVKSSITLGAFPNSTGVITWLPADKATQTILELVWTEKQLPLVVNVVHPRPIPWNIMIEQVRDVVAQTLHFSKEMLPLVDFTEWVRRLAENAKNGETEEYGRTPAIKLLDFFQQVAKAENLNQMEESGQVIEVGGITQFDTEKAQGRSMTMKSIPPLQLTDMNAWVSYWKGLGFL